MLSFYMSLLNNDYDRGKFEEYYSLYRQDMYRIAYSILHNYEDAEDACCLPRKTQKIDKRNTKKSASETNHWRI